MVDVRIISTSVPFIPILGTTGTMSDKENAETFCSNKGHTPLRELVQKPRKPTDGLCRPRDRSPGKVRKVSVSPPVVAITTL